MTLLFAMKTDKEVYLASDGRGYNVVAGMHKNLEESKFIKVNDHVEILIAGNLEVARGYYTSAQHALWAKGLYERDCDACEIAKSLEQEINPSFESLIESFEDLIKSFESLIKSFRNTFITSVCNIKENEYLFSWDNVPGNDNEKLKKYLLDKIGIGWAETAKIRKSDDNMALNISMDENSVEIVIDENKEKATLKSGGRIHELKVKKDSGKLNIYEKNAVFAFLNEDWPLEIFVGGWDKDENGDFVYPVIYLLDNETHYKKRKTDTKDFVLGGDPDFYPVARRYFEKFLPTDASNSSIEIGRSIDSCYKKIICLCR